MTVTARRQFKAPKVKISAPLQSLLDTSKHESRLLGDVQRMLLGRMAGEGRAQDILHPSAICRDEWCQRAGYYQLAGVPPVEEKQSHSWRMEMVFDEGHEIHDKWQRRIWDLGKLLGNWYCIHCRKAWWGQAPDECPTCRSAREFIRYHEVPLFHGGYRIGGHADGLIPGALIEIKSIGVGTVRFENKPLLDKHTYKFNVNGKERTFVDLDKVWDEIRRPFPSHIRQAHLYSLCTGHGRGKELVEEEIFIYECKWNQSCKEFVVRYRQERIQPILDSCRRITDALESHRPPACSHSEDGCPDCRRYETSTNGRGLPQDDGGHRPRRTFRHNGAG